MGFKLELTLGGIKPAGWHVCVGPEMSRACSESALDGSLFRNIADR